MDELCNALGVIFVTRLLTGNLTEVLGPRIKAYMKIREEKESGQTFGRMSRVEEEFNYGSFHFVICGLI